jgi:hypothetical protein
MGTPAAPQAPPSLPDLRVVAVADLLLHEQHDTQRSEPLLRRLQADQVLRNPPIVAAIDGDSRFVVLDGANRVTAFERMDLPHIVVQVVDYGNVELALNSWHHLVTGLAREVFNGQLERLAGLIIEPASLLHARAQLARREAMAFIVHPGNDVRTVCVDGTLHERVARLNDMVDIYRSSGRIFRVDTDHLEGLLPHYDDVTALVVFARHDPAEIVELARLGARLPAGITRHVIQRRALRVDVPLAELREAKSLADKNAALDVWVKSKVERKQVRFYQESTFLFDE